MEIIEVYPVEESAAYVRILESRIQALMRELDIRRQREDALVARTVIMDEQQVRMAELLQEADRMLEDQIDQCRQREALILTREDQLDDREDHLVTVQITQDTAFDRIRGLIVEE